MKVRYRFYDARDEQSPMHGDYLMSARGRGGYLIVGVDDRGPRGGLGEPIYQLLLLSVERVSRTECLEHGERFLHFPSGAIEPVLDVFRLHA